MSAIHINLVIFQKVKGSQIARLNENLKLYNWARFVSNNRICHKPIIIIKLKFMAVKPYITRASSLLKPVTQYRARLKGGG